MLFKNSKKIKVNYSLRTPDAELLFDEPKLIKTIHETKCPAHTKLSHDTYALIQPYNAELEIGYNHFVLKNSEINDDNFFSMNTLRMNDNLLIFQINYPYYFFTDDKELFLETLPPDYSTKHTIPRSNFVRGGFKPYAWSRSVHPAFSFELDNTQIINVRLIKGEPICYIKFNKNVDINYKQWNDTYEKEHLKVFNITDLVSNVGSLYNRALKRRPNTLL